MSEVQMKVKIVLTPVSHGFMGRNCFMDAKIGDVNIRVKELGWGPDTETDPSRTGSEMTLTLDTRTLMEALRASPQMEEEFDKAFIEEAAKRIYAQWHELPGYVPWVEGGNSLKQDEAREKARDLLPK